MIGLINAITLFLQYEQYVNSAKPIVCFVGNSCESVLDSKYGVTFGVKNEISGIGYYIFLIMSMLVLYLNKHKNIKLQLLIKLAAFGAGVFSLYLLGIQEFVLHQFCFRCIIAISINILLLISVFSIRNNDIDGELINN